MISTGGEAERTDRQVRALCRHPDQLAAAEVTSPNILQPQRETEIE
jgi:hypothetical protein